MSRALLSTINIPTVDFTVTTGNGTIGAGSNPPAATGAYRTWTSTGGLEMGYTSSLTNQGVSARWTPPAPLNWSESDYLILDVERPADVASPFLQIWFKGDAGAVFTNYARLVSVFGSYQTRTRVLVKFSALDRVGTASTNLRVFLQSIKDIEFRFIDARDSTSPKKINIYGMWLGRSRAKCLISYDNILSSVYSAAWGKSVSTGWRAAGFKGTMFMSETDLSDVVNSMTVAQVQEIYADGWDLGLQNSDDTETIYWNRALTLTFAGNVATFTATNNYPHQYLVGEQITVSGANEPQYNGTFTVASVPNAWTLTYNMASTPAYNADGSQIVIPRKSGLSTREGITADIARSRAMAQSIGCTRGNEFFSYSASIYSVQNVDWMRSAGIAMAWTAQGNSGNSIFDARATANTACMAFPRVGMDQRTAAQVLADLDVAIEYGLCVCLGGHGVDATGTSLHMAQAEFNLLVAGVKARVNQGLMDVVTPTQLRQQMLSARAVT